MELGPICTCSAAVAEPRKGAMKILAGLLSLALIAVPADALARGGGHHSGGSHSSGHHGGHVHGFAMSQCKSAACHRKHPDGKYVHPLQLLSIADGQCR